MSPHSCALDLPRPATPAPAADVTVAADESSSGRRWFVLAVLAAVAFMAQLDLFIVNVAVPVMATAFGHAPLASVSWVLNAYALAFAGLLVPAGRLADHFGRRRFLLSGVALFIAASALCALAPDLVVVIVGRALQGVGAALIVPTSLGLLFPAFARREHGLVVGIWAGVAAIAAASGPTLGGLLLALSWRWIFIINVPIGVATIAAGLRVIPEVRAERTDRLPDAVSGLAVFAAITLLVLGTTQGPTWGWADVRTVTVLVGAVIAVGASVKRSSRPGALIESALFHSRRFATATLGLLLFYVAFAAWLLVTVLFLQATWHESPLEAGFAIAPGPLSAAAFALNSGRISRRLGGRVPAVVGTLSFAAASLFWLATTPLHPDYLAGFLPGLILGGAGAGLTQAPLFAAASSLAADRATTGSAVLNMARQVGSAMGVAVLVALGATAHPASLLGYHRAWFFIAVTCLSATIAIGIGSGDDRASS